MLVGFVTPLAIDRDSIWWRIVRGIALAATTLLTFWLTVLAYQSFYGGQMPRKWIAPFYVIVSVQYLVPIAYAVVRWLGRPPK